MWVIFKLNTLHARLSSNSLPSVYVNVYVCVPVCVCAFHTSIMHAYVNPADKASDKKVFVNLLEAKLDNHSGFFLNAIVGNLFNFIIIIPSYSIFNNKTCLINPFKIRCVK